MDDITTKTVDDIYDYLKKIDEHIAGWDYNNSIPTIMIPMSVKEKVESFFPGTFTLNTFSRLGIDDELGSYHGLDKNLDIACMATPAIRETFIIGVSKEAVPHKHYRYSTCMLEMDSDESE